MWYKIRSHDPTHKTVHLDAEDKEVEVHIDGLAFRADRPVKTIVVFERSWGSRRAESHYVGTCPKGHEYELGPVPPTQVTTKCPECNREWGWERETVTPV
jgi:hypothetical protein